MQGESSFSSEQTVRAAIRASPGRWMSFATFMEMALYGQKTGYYRRPGPSPIGPDGDFVTSVSATPLFGRILARRIAAHRREIGHPAGYTVVEFGAHRGQLQADILAEVPDLDYVTVEVGQAMPDGITGCVLANELLDALPVHRVRVVGGEWRELGVVEAPGPDGALVEAPGPLSDPRLATALADLPAHLMEGYTSEVNLRALDWLEAVSGRLTRGLVIVIDYGYERHEYFAPHRHAGTLTAYHRHRRGGDPFTRIGEQDLTAHVEFSSLIARAAELGLRRTAFVEQGRYLLEAGEDLVREIVERDAGAWSRERAALQQLMHPDHMGRAFRVLELRRDGNPSSPQGRVVQ